MSEEMEGGGQLASTSDGATLLSGAHGIFKARSVAPNGKNIDAVLIICLRGRKQMTFGHRASLARTFGTTDRAVQSFTPVTTPQGARSIP
jgi:hypothetical protein